MQCVARLVIWASSGQWHTLLFGGQVAVDVRVVCPQDLKKKFLKLARMWCRRRWAAKHEGFFKRISHVHAQE